MSVENLGSGGRDAKSNSGNWTDIGIALVVSAAFLCALVWVALHFTLASSAPALVLAGLFGAATGWATGILISPYNPEEKSAFGETSKVIYGFLTGFVISKFDPLLTEAVNSRDAGQWLLICFAFIAFLVSTCLTYISRKYWR